MSVAPNARRRGRPALPWLFVAGFAAAGAITGGCSFVFVDGPKARASPNDKPQCDRGRHWIVVDGLWAGVQVATLSADRDRANRASYAVAITATVLHLASSMVGLRRTKRCKEAFRAYNADPKLRAARRARRQIEREQSERARIENVRRRCDKPIARWRAERDFSQKAILFRDLDDECKALVWHR